MNVPQETLLGIIAELLGQAGHLARLAECEELAEAIADSADHIQDILEGN